MTSPYPCGVEVDLLKSQGINLDYILEPRSPHAQPSYIIEQNVMITQPQAKDRLIIKRQLRLLGATVENNESTINLALALRALIPEFVFPVNVAIDLTDYDRANNPKYTAKTINTDWVGNSALNQKIAVAIQNLADNLAWFLNDGWDRESAIHQVFSNSDHRASFVKALVLEAVGI